MQAVPLRSALRQLRPDVWEAGRLDMAPDQWWGRISTFHTRKGGSWSPAANEWLLDVTERMAGIRVPVSLSDAEICSLAASCAREALSLAMSAPATARDGRIVASSGPAGDWDHWSGMVLMTLPGLRARLDAFVRSYGIKPPEPLRMATKGRRKGQMVGVTDAGAVRRMTDSQWWRRALRRHQARAIEREAITLGYVHRRGEIYASDVTVERRGQQRRRNAATLEATEAINLDTGEIYTLADLAERANSNPAIRRGELMTRIAGFEAIAQGLDHAADFWTITAPSKYHAKIVTGEDNPKYSGATPRETQGYLTSTWAKCRAALKRLGLAVYGFRIAEPHHDGTPHWHCLFFMARAEVKEVRRVVRDYFLREDGDEPGAAKNRVKFVEIDPTIGTAAGYIAKYVAKNIDGFQVQGDFEGENLSAVTGSQRVEAWAAAWGIRQFQQIGGAPVGVWRELRRMRDADKAHGPEMTEARAAADAGNWRRYVECQGGPTVERRNLRFRVAYTRAGEKWDAKNDCPGPANPTRYGEIAPPSIFGVWDMVRDRSHVSRFFRWEIRRANRGGKGGIQAGGSREAGIRHEMLSGVASSDVARRESGSMGTPDLRGVYVVAEGGPGEGKRIFVGNGCFGSGGLGVGVGVPRTCVNNCTGVSDVATVASDQWPPEFVGRGHGGGGSGLHHEQAGEDQGGGRIHAGSSRGIDGGGRPSDRRGGGAGPQGGG